jgi:hypothetical protein
VCFQGKFCNAIIRSAHIHICSAYNVRKYTYCYQTYTDAILALLLMLLEIMSMNSKHALERCQDLSQQPNSAATTIGYCISYLNDGLIAVGCSNGYIQLLDTAKLTKIAILPTTPPIGHANITNIRVMYCNL